jgi:Polysaccharide lyase family 4, domain II
MKCRPKWALVALLVAIATGCSSPVRQRNPLPPSGGALDDGSGWLAQVAAKLPMSDGESRESLSATESDRYARYYDQDQDADWQTMRPNALRSKAMGGDGYGGYRLPLATSGLPPPTYPLADGSRSRARSLGSITGSVRWSLNRSVIARSTVEGTACAAAQQIRDTFAGVVIEVLDPQSVDLYHHREFVAARQTPIVLHWSPCGWTPSTLVAPLYSVARIEAGTAQRNINVVNSTDGVVTEYKIAANNAAAAVMKSGTNYVRSQGVPAAEIRVPSSPLFAVTDDDGNFEIPDVEPGVYKITAWKSSNGNSSKEILVSQSVTVLEGKSASMKISLPTSK